MNVKELIKALEKCDPELDVLVTDLNNSSHVWGFLTVEETVSEGEFPDDYNMPEGYRFVRLDV